ncbi:RNA methyltransferase [Pseudothauera nasutitermitis]|uniref:RNA methyltransferase n=1 Tax=Pseudothauera nasutitermitis TaxID=2565930 RepID=A0A4S4B194_9RHOO|nr:RNA methyltransferase [Pseudothauera nasutitermitis]THF66209.1 RNA methyltransferase [Pseudothauera nasutitermitis]
MKAITSRDNPTVRRLRALAGSARERRKLGQSVLDGAHLITAALDAGWTLRELAISEQGLQSAEIVRLAERCAGTSCEVLRLPDAVLAQISPVDTPAGILASFDLPAEPAPRAFTDSLLVLDGVQDAGNLGAILRTAAAAGIQDALLSPGCAQAWAPRVLRAGMGAHFALRIHERADLAAALAGYPGQVLATALRDDSWDLYELDLRAPVAWLFGAEGQGLSPEALALASRHVRIPMPGRLESLNVGAAVAICLFEQLRQRRDMPTR